MMFGNYINIMKTTFDQAFNKQHGYTKTWKQRDAVNKISFSLITNKLEIMEKIVNN